MIKVDSITVYGLSTELVVTWAVSKTVRGFLPGGSLGVNVASGITALVIGNYVGLKASRHICRKVTESRQRREGNK